MAKQRMDQRSASLFPQGGGADTQGDAPHARRRLRPDGARDAEGLLSWRAPSGPGRRGGQSPLTLNRQAVTRGLAAPRPPRGGGHSTALNPAAQKAWEAGASQVCGW